MFRKNVLFSHTMGLMRVSAEFLLKRHWGGFIREAGTLQIDVNGQLVSYRDLNKETRAQIREWSGDQIEELNFLEHVYRERESG